MEQFVIEQINAGLKYLPVNLLKSKFIKKSNSETKEMRKNGFICGVCHPNKNYAQIRDANIGWIRIDIPFPLDADGKVTDDYISFKAKCLGYVQNKIKVMAVTPYPRYYIENGMDFREPGGEEKQREIARFLITDLKGFVSGIQVTNELGMPHFTLPLNSMEEASRFIGITLEEMYPLRGDIIIGYNSAGPQADLHSKMLTYLSFCDYVGIDMYLGCFAYIPGFMFMFDAMLGYLWALTRKPIIIQEFGYMSGGEPRTNQQRANILKGYGFNNENEVKNNAAAFVERLPESLSKHVKHVAKNDESRYYNLLFNSDLKNHVYLEMPGITKIPGYPHSPNGQAAFYEHVLQRFYNMPFVCGTIIYCYQDSSRCYICGQSDCPIETRWGLVDLKGEPKPSYYSVRTMFGRFKWLKNTEK